MHCVERFRYVCLFSVKGEGELRFEVEESEIDTSEKSDCVSGKAG